MNGVDHVRDECMSLYRRGPYQAENARSVKTAREVDRLALERLPESMTFGRPIQSVDTTNQTSCPARDSDRERTDVVRAGDNTTKLDGQSYAQVN